MDNRIQISIVIVNYNTKNFTSQCLDSIQHNPPSTRYEVIVIDNASNDDSVDWLEENYPDIVLIRSPKNLGIAGGNNMGIRASSGKYVLLLNNDTIVMEGAIDRCAKFLDQHPRAGGVGGQLLNPDGSFQSGGVDFINLWRIFLITSKIGYLIRPFYPSHPPHKKIRQVDWLSTAFMLFRRRALEDVGFVDEDYFIYSDESDLQYRLWKDGWKIFYLPDVKTIHFGGKSLTPWKRRKMVYRGYLLFFHKHRGLFQATILRLIFSTISTLKLPLWAGMYLISTYRERASKEIKSNWEIVKMCFQPGITPPS